jgi:hypothetical protein
VSERKKREFAPYFPFSLGTFAVFPLFFLRTLFGFASAKKAPAPTFALEIASRGFTDKMSKYKTSKDKTPNGTKRRMVQNVEWKNAKTSDDKKVEWYKTSNRK